VRVLVVGGGIGGLAVAIGLRATGHEVMVLERSPALEPVGAGITLFANAMRALDRLGVAHAVAARGAAGRDSAILTSDGRELTKLPADLIDGTVAIHRGELQSVLLAAAGEVALGAEVTEVEQDDRAVTARIAGAASERADLLVAADGLRSVVRQRVASAPVRYGGYTAWRGVATISIAPGRLSESWGVGERFGLVDIGSSGTYWFATRNAPEGEFDRPEERKAELLERFSRWHSPIAEVIEATPPDGILRNDVYYLDPLPTWSRGRIVLLGDSAHATTPGVGQGAAQALEDAVALSTELARGDELRSALTRYESVRRPRTTMVLKQSRRADQAAQLSSPLVCRIRNAITRRIPASLQRRQLAPLIEYQLP
jgi:2-polyprenyl-6-methoxyphenol hydroxylase-like FAD-dependent oxidoreductase